jgi:hypothetical protein
VSIVIATAFVTITANLAGLSKPEAHAWLGSSGTWLTKNNASVMMTFFLVIITEVLIGKGIGAL